MSLKTPVSSSSYPQTLSAIELATTFFPSVIDKHQNNSVLIPKIPSRMMQPSQTMTTYSLVRHKKNYIIPTISTPNHHSQNITTTSSSILSLQTPTILPLVGKEYMCFMKEGQSSQSVRCIKSRIITKVINFVISIE